MQLHDFMAGSPFQGPGLVWDGFDNLAPLGRRVLRRVAHDTVSRVLRVWGCVEFYVQAGSKNGVVRARVRPVSMFLAAKAPCRQFCLPLRKAVTSPFC